LLHSCLNEVREIRVFGRGKEGRGPSLCIETSQKTLFAGKSFREKGHGALTSGDNVPTERTSTAKKNQEDAKTKGEEKRGVILPMIGKNKKNLAVPIF